MRGQTLPAGDGEKVVPVLPKRAGRLGRRYLPAKEARRTFQKAARGSRLAGTNCRREFASGIA